MAPLLIAPLRGESHSASDFTGRKLFNPGEVYYHE
jgi:hypothetical protein